MLHGKTSHELPRKTAAPLVGFVVEAAGSLLEAVPAVTGPRRFRRLGTTNEALAVLAHSSRYPPWSHTTEPRPLRGAPRGYVGGSAGRQHGGQRGNWHGAFRFERKVDAAPRAVGGRRAPWGLPGLRAGWALLPVHWVSVVTARCRRRCSCLGGHRAPGVGEPARGGVAAGHEAAELKHLRLDGARRSAAALGALLHVQQEALSGCLVAIPAVRWGWGARRRAGAFSTMAISAE